jgi:protein transport protein SEC23
VCRNVWPSSRIDATRVVVPFGSLVTPTKVIPGMPVLPYEPVGCKSCRAVLNPYCRVDFVGKIWICPFCLQRNSFPRNYADINEANLPAELFPQYTTVEYQVSTNPNPALPRAVGKKSVVPAWALLAPVSERSIQKACAGPKSPDFLRLVLA